MVKRHTRPNPAQQIKGGIAERESMIRCLQRDGGQLERRADPRRDTASNGTGAAMHRVRIARKAGEVLEQEADNRGWKQWPQDSESTIKRTWFRRW